MYPEFLPTAATGLTETTSQELARQLQRVSVATPWGEVLSTYVCAGAGTPPLLLLHGFDSSLLEFRRLVPQLTPQAQTWAVDLLGFGFCARTSPSLDPGAIKLHLHSFWQQQIAQPVVLVGASMGGAAAIDFALTYPQATAGLVLIDSAGFAAGPAMGRFMFPPLDRWATNFLRSPRVRRKISQQAYCDRNLVTPDAELCAALHLECPGWAEALIAFTQSGGYNFLADKISQLRCPTQIIWGSADRILGTRDAERFLQAIPHSQLTWVPDCGHVPHLEAPAATAEAIGALLQRL